MTVTQDTLGIGELARRTGVPVRTLRFYCDEGVLTPLRSTGGHRRFEATAVEHVRQLRRLRAVGLGLDTITEVLSGTRSLADALASARARAEADLAAAAWRQATLQAIAQAPPGAREARLDLLA
ncbi:MerR family transcriptional regulator, partial [Crossiella equi]